MFVNVFSFKISSTHVIFSALASNAILFLPAEYVNYYWLAMEFFFWILTPIFSVLLSYFMHYLIEKYLLNDDNAIERMIIFIPFQISATCFFMTFLLVVKYLSDEIKS